MNIESVYNLMFLWRCILEHLASSFREENSKEEK
jgi:hypothetical protein